MGTCQIKINGIALDVAVGTTILEAAAQAGIEIPAMCYDPRLKPYGACRMCLVEVAGARGPVAACTTPVRDGMDIATTSEEIEGLRRTALEFMLAEHYGDCVAPCHLACPAGIDIQGFIALIADGRNAESLRLIKEQMPFPATCGRVCPRFCETDCRRNIVDEPVGIMHLKRHVADIDLDQEEPYTPLVAPATGKTVGIIGGGPAGLTAAYYLAIAGHSVTVYEACPELGGMLRYAIPEYRLPKALLDREIATITKLCHEVKCDTKLGRDITLADLQAEHDAVIVAVGAASSQMIGVDGESLTGNYGGLDFLAKYTAGQAPPITGRVAVVGGGNTAIDCARTALRMGAAEVTIVYRRSRSEMPASLEEIEGAEEEGVKFRFLANPVSCGCRDQDGRMAALTCVEMALGEPDASGRRRPQPVPGSDFVMDVDTVIWATGQMLNPEGLSELDKARNGFIVTDDASQTNQSKVFATADCVTGPTTVVEAVGAAHKTAVLVDAYLSGKPVELPAEPYNHTKGKLSEVKLSEYESTEKIAREAVHHRAGEDRAHDFIEIDPGHRPEQALRESARCLSCGCQDVHDCLLRDYATDYGVRQPAGLRVEPLPVQAEHELVVRDSNKCILCGSCVRICSEIQGASALGFVARGYKALVEPTLGRSLTDSPCESCQQCISACPTGALTPVVPLPKPGPFVLDKVRSVCPECSVGCELAVGTKAGLLVGLESPLRSAVSEGNLCKHGALLLSRLGEAERVARPLVRSAAGDQLVAAGWDQALSKAAEHLAAARDAGGSLAVYVSGRSTSEEAALAKRLAGGALGSAQLVGLPTGVAAGLAALEQRTASFKDLAAADFVLAVEADMPEKYPVAAIRIRQATDRGATFASISSCSTKLDHLAAPALVTGSSGEISSLLRAMAGCSGSSGCSECAKLGAQLGVDAAALSSVMHAYKQAQRPVIVAGLDALTAEQAALLAQLADLNGQAAFIGLSKWGNARGLYKAGVGTGAGCCCGEDASAIAAAIGTDLDEQGFGGLVIVGVKPGAADGKSDRFVLCIAPVLTGAASEQADIVLPGSVVFETTGTMTNAEGRTQPVNRATTAPGGRDSATVLRELSGRLGYPIEASSHEEAVAGSGS